MSSPIPSLPHDPPAPTGTDRHPALERSKSRELRELKKACQDFEAIFIQSLFKSMRKTVIDSGLFEKDNAHEIYQDMLDAEIAHQTASQQSMGLADQMYRQMLRYLPEEKNEKKG